MYCNHFCFIEPKNQTLISVWSLNNLNRNCHHQIVQKWEGNKSFVNNTLRYVLIIIHSLEFLSLYHFVFLKLLIVNSTVCYLYNASLDLNVYSNLQVVSIFLWNYHKYIYLRRWFWFLLNRASNMLKAHVRKPYVV